MSRYGSQALFLSSGGYHHHIGLNTWNSKGGTIPEAESVGMKSYSISVIKEERERIAERLTKLGFSVEIDGGQYWSQDPSGNIIYF